VYEDLALQVTAANARVLNRRGKSPTTSPRIPPDATAPRSVGTRFGRPSPPNRAPCRVCSQSWFLNPSRARLRSPG
jgi:hypothetical protein